MAGLYFLGHVFYSVLLKVFLLSIATLIFTFAISIVHDGIYQRRLKAARKKIERLEKEANAPLRKQYEDARQAILDKIEEQKRIVESA